MVSRTRRRKIIIWMMDLGWQFAEPKTEYFDRYRKKEQVWWWRNQQGILIMVEKKKGQEVWRRIRMLACDYKDFVEILNDVCLFATENRYVGVTWITPLPPIMLISCLKRDLSAIGMPPC